ncbi:hypothetical protein H7200_01145 [Candidatus Saccharibacteria bacterium]|nr:hypothetical protein [Candidatus Saccharibacteria bacterium]
MSLQHEFVPVGKHVASSHQLELDSHAQQNLIYEMKRTGQELQDSPVAQPYFKEVKIGRIALLNSDGYRAGSDKLWLQYSEMNDGRRNAIIDLQEGETQTRFHLSQSSQSWNVLQRASHRPTQTLSNEDMVAILHPKMRNKEVLAALMDTTQSDAMAIPHLLAGFLYKSAGRREKKLLYQSNDALIQGGGSDTVGDASFVSSVETSLAIRSVNGRHIHTLRARAPYVIGNTVVTKEYSYEAETSDAMIYKAAGKVSLESSDGYSQAEFEPYLRLDKSVNEPLFALHRNLAILRSSHGLTDEVAA